MVIVEVVVVVGVVAAGVWALGRYLDRGNRKNREEIDHPLHRDDDDEMAGSH